MKFLTGKTLVSHNGQLEQIGNLGNISKLGYRRISFIQTMTVIEEIGQNQ
jgi:hypothetical protein